MGKRKEVEDVQTDPIYTNSLFRVQAEIIDRLPARQSCRTILYHPRELTDNEIMDFHDEIDDAFVERLGQEALDQLRNPIDHPQENIE